MIDIPGSSPESRSDLLIASARAAMHPAQQVICTSEIFVRRCLRGSLRDRQGVVSCSASKISTRHGFGLELPSGSWPISRPWASRSMASQLCRLSGWPPIVKR